MCAAYLSPVLPRAGLFHGPGDPIAPGKDIKTTNTWRNGLSSPFSTFLRKPTTLLGSFVPSRGSAASQQVDRARDIENRKSVLRFNLGKASSLEAWRATAAELDDLEGNDLWKFECESNEYNSALVRSRLEQLEDARFSNDTSRMLFLIRTALTRHLGGMGNIRLYQHSHIGTKTLIDEYIRSALDTLAAILDLTQQQLSDDMSNRHLLEQILAARQSFGRSALLLSGGGTFGMYHIGVTKCLWEQRLLPRIVSGASAGSIVCAVLCVRTDEELPATIEELCTTDLEVFTKTGIDDTPVRQITHFLKRGALFDTANLTRVMKRFLGDMTFQEAYNRTRRILNICVSSAGLYELPRLLNYVTSPNVIIWSAV